MSVSVSLPDDLVQRADAHAIEASRTREEIVAEALEHYLTRRSQSHLTECIKKSEERIAAINAVIDEFGQPTDEVMLSAAARILKNSEW